MLTALAIVVLIVLVLIGVPMWASVLTGATLLSVVALGMNPTMIVSIFYEKISQSSLIAVPLFIFSGEILAIGGAAKPLVKVLNSFLGHVPGGSAYVMVVACAIFGAMSSSATAAIAAFGPLLIPMMMESGYSKSFSLGLLISSVSLAPLIPPSIPLIIFGFLTNTSVRDLYLAGFPAGLLLAVLLCVTIFFHAVLRKGHYAPPAKSNWSDRWQAIKEGWPVLIMPPIVTLPIYMGITTASEAAVIAAIYSVILGFVAYKKLTIRSTWEALRRTQHVTTMIFVIVGSAFILNLGFTYLRFPFQMSDWLGSSGFNSFTFLIVVFFIFFLMGCFLDPSAILMITAPLLMPTVTNLGISPVVFGVFTVYSVELAGVTPPYGLALFTAVAVLKEEFGFVARSGLLFWPALMIGQLMIAFIPPISLCLTYLKH